MAPQFENQTRPRRPTAARCEWSCIQDTKAGVYTTIARYVTGEKACYAPADLQYRISEHVREYMYKNLQHYSWRCQGSN
jgi:hypothetical protein